MIQKVDSEIFKAVVYTGLIIKSRLGDNIEIIDYFAHNAYYLFYLASYDKINKRS